MVSTTMAFLVALIATGATQSDGQQSQLAVMPLMAKRMPPETVEVLDELLLTAVERYSDHSVIGASDINAMLGLERMKELVGCDDLSCAAEIGGALGVHLLLAGSVSRLGDDVFVSLKLIDIRGSSVKRRGQSQVNNDENLYSKAVNDALGQVFGSEPAKVSAGPRLERSPSRTMYEQFVDVGLGKRAYHDFTASGLPYRIWAKQYNRESESVVLELAKWLCTASSAIVITTLLSVSSGEDDGNVVFIASTPIVITSLSLWTLDLWNIGDAPSELPGLE